ncbi:MAG: TolB family protein [Planctomycetota bacterium]|jgi:Tol biopolymer transport system component
MIRRLHRLAAAAGLVAFVALATAASPANPRATWVLVARGADAFHAVDVRNGRYETIGKARPHEVLSPDGKLVAYVEVGTFQGMTYTELYVANADGTRPRQLTSGARNPRELAWMPNGRDLLLVRGTGDHTQVYMMDATSDDRVQRRVSAGGKQSWSPSASVDGRVAYTVLKERKGKEQLCDLVLYHDGKRKTIVRRQHITDHAFSPDGGKLAYSLVGKLVVLDLGTGKSTELEYPSINRRLRAHYGRDITWRPDGRLIAMRIVFAGGRAFERGKKPKPLLGDREIFLIPEEGETRWIPAPPDCEALQWREVAKMPRRRGR